MDINIKKMETEDEIRGKAFVHWKSWQEAYPGLVDQNYLDALTLAKCEEIAFKWPDNILIAKDGGRVIGFAGYGKCRNDDLPAAGEIFAIYVLSEYYGTGTGQRLVQAALKELNYPQVALWVLKGNERAIRFYKKCGFIFDGAEEELMLGSPVTALRMIKEQIKGK